MKRTFILILVITIFSCKNEKKQETETQIFGLNNKELIGINISDQAGRNAHNKNLG